MRFSDRVLPLTVRGERKKGQEVRNIPEGVCWVCDPGHGWLRVPIVSAEGLDVSEYSYVDRRNGWLYLEEDCDATIWLRAHDAMGLVFPVEHLNGDAPCRSLPHVQVVKV